MSVRNRRTRRAVVAGAIAVAAAVTALLPVTADAATAHVVNGTTKTNRLTISTGTKYVVMNGTRVNFGVIVRDLAWSPDGKKAAFVDGNGNLDTANADGSGRHTVAVNPGHQIWSHPTWQVAKADGTVGVKAKNNLVFTVNKGGSLSLKRISATASHGTPAALPLGHYSGEGSPNNPTTGNNWANGGGAYGTIVYDNVKNGEIYVRDDYIRQQGGAVTKGSEPALSPNGEEIVFVRSVKGHDHIFTSDTAGKHVKDLTPHSTTDYTEPTWAPDGKTIVFRTPQHMARIPANGSTLPVEVSTYTGLAAYRG